MPVYLIDAFSAGPVAANVEITPANPSPVAYVTTSFLGRSPRNVPDGSLATCSVSFGTLLTDDDLTVSGNQAAALNGSATARLTSTTKGSSTVNFSMGGSTAAGVVTFVDKYPPPQPLGLTLTPQYTNTGSSLLAWTPSVDAGGAGTSLYTIERSTWSGSAWGAFAVVTTSVVPSVIVSGPADGKYRFRVKAHDADGNVGSYSINSLDLVVDTVAPSVIPCVDNKSGHANTDPDETYSYDPNIYFYYTAIDDRSGPGEVQVQVSTTTADLSGLVEEPWVPVSSYYLFQDGKGFNTYYARVRVKDRAGNTGNWGSWSNGLTVVMTDATSSPNSPTIFKVGGKNAVSGIPVPLNFASNIVVEGISESSNLIMVYVDGVYKGSTPSTPEGVFAPLINLTAGTHKVKVRAHNGFAESGDSNEITVVVDLLKPKITRRIYDANGYERGEPYLGTTPGSAHRLNTIDFILSDTGGAGFDISTAEVTLSDIDDSGVLIPAVGTYTNPVVANLEIISADRVRIVPTFGWNDCLQDQHLYRLNYQLKDFAGNLATSSFDFVIDNKLPGEADEVPVTVPPDCNIKSLYLYNAELFPGTTAFTIDDLVPFKFNSASNAFMIDPAYDNPALVDKTSSPPSLRFNTLGFYGTMYVAEPSPPATKKGHDSKSRSMTVVWGYGSSIATGPDGLGNSNVFRINYITLVNGPDKVQLCDQDYAIRRDYQYVSLNIYSALAAPKPPNWATFKNAADPESAPYYVWSDYNKLFPGGGSPVNNRHVLITDNPNALLVTVSVPIDTMVQEVQIYCPDDGFKKVIASASVGIGNATATLIIDQSATSGKMNFLIRTFANGYYSATLPNKGASYVYYHWIKNDFTPPQTFDIFPTELYYNALSGPDARPFPTQFSVKAKDTADGAVQSFIDINNSTISMQSFSGTPLSGDLTRDYDITNDLYGYRFNLISVPTTPGTYYYKLSLPDGSRPTFHTTNASYPFKLDTVGPIPLEINPSDGLKTNSLPSFNVLVFD